MGARILIDTSICGGTLPPSERICEEDVEVTSKETVLRQKSLAVAVCRAFRGWWCRRDVATIDGAYAVLEIGPEARVGLNFGVDIICGGQVHMLGIEWVGRKQSSHLAEVSASELKY